MRKVNFVLALVVVFSFVFTGCEKETSLNKTQEQIELEKNLGVELILIEDNAVLGGVEGTSYQTINTIQNVFIPNDKMEKDVPVYINKFTQSGGCIYCNGEGDDCNYVIIDDGVHIVIKPWICD